MTAEVDRLVEALHHLADSDGRGRVARDNLFVDTDAVRRLSRQIRLEQSFGHRDSTAGKHAWSISCAIAGSRGRGRGRGYKCGTGVTRADGAGGA